MLSVFNAPAERPSGRFFLIDAIKACACLLIVGHHLAFYGPMSDVVATAWPTAMGWLYEHGRLAVQFFLVCAGFLTAGNLARFESLGWDQALRLAWQRYLRLTIPLLAALSLTVWVTEWVRPDFAHGSLSATPDLWQALAHLLLLQDVLGLEALSAGIWYVAIDFQLYLMALLGLVCVKAWPRPANLKLGVHGQSAHWAHRLRWGLWLGGLLASLGWWNLNPDWDHLGLYFWGSYALGLWAWAVRQHADPTYPADHVRTGPTASLGLSKTAAGLVMLVVGLVAWWLEPRVRMAVAFSVAALLIAVPGTWLTGQALGLSRWRSAVQRLSAVSYAVFLSHFGVSLAVSATVTWHWPNALWANALGMGVSVLLSLLVGTALHWGVERAAPTWRRCLAWASVWGLSVALAMR